MRLNNKRITDYVDPLVFMIAFSLGILYTYVSHTPDKTHVIVKYPTYIKNNEEIYRDDTNMCYTYSVTETQCPANKKDIFVVPIQDSLKRANAEEDANNKSASRHKKSIVTRLHNYLFNIK